MNTNVDMEVTPNMDLTFNEDVNPNMAIPPNFTLPPNIASASRNETPNIVVPVPSVARPFNMLVLSNMTMYSNIAIPARILILPTMGSDPHVGVTPQVDVPTAMETPPFARTIENMEPVTQMPIALHMGTAPYLAIAPSFMGITQHVQALPYLSTVPLLGINPSLEITPNILPNVSMQHDPSTHEAAYVAPCQAVSRDEDITPLTPNSAGNYIASGSGSNGTSRCDGRIAAAAPAVLASSSDGLLTRMAITPDYPTVSTHNGAGNYDDPNVSHPEKVAASFNSRNRHDISADRMQGQIRPKSEGPIKSGMKATPDDPTTYRPNESGSSKEQKKPDPPVAFASMAGPSSANTEHKVRQFFMPFQTRPLPHELRSTSGIDTTPNRHIIDEPHAPGNTAEQQKKYHAAHSDIDPDPTSEDKFNKVLVDGVIQLPMRPGSSGHRSSGITITPAPPTALRIMSGPDVPGNRDAPTAPFLPGANGRSVVSDMVITPPSPNNPTHAAGNDAELEESDTTDPASPATSATVFSEEDENDSIFGDLPPLSEHS